ncbi:general secretion pathway protein [Geomonas sp. Red32]|uniref:GspE/PulE/PilB domain-containing protein n=1 Tax=Geomonas sp. Red32 TaxID=2912856 RepID=UPI00202CF0BC|nr:general secretion pathway protein [Geomonas sp. Red32]MCM0080926.1 general secretion pathway protein [Geomonas sp. Red32]
MKLGELLVSAGKLTPEQVEETLKGQAIFGGRFGTNLVEMGYIDETELAHFLSRKTGVPEIPPDQLMDVSPQTLKLVPEEMVRKYRVIPVGLNNRKLILAMADPSDFAAIDEISFVTGYIIRPVITPELRLITALEKHYNIRREMRYIKVEGGGRNRSRQLGAQQEPAQTAAAQAVAAKAAAALQAQEDEEVLELPLLGDLDSFPELEELEFQMQLRNEPSAPPAQPAPAAFAPDAFAPAAPAAAAFASPAAPAPAEKDYTLNGVLRGFTKADDRDEIGDLIVNHLGRQFNRVGLVLLKGGRANGWFACANKQPVADFDRLEISLDEPSILKLIVDSKDYYLGPMPVTPANNALVGALGGGTPVNNLLVPLMMVGRVVGVLYVEGGMTNLLDQVAPLQKLLGKASMAFEILIMKNKILLT